MKKVMIALAVVAVIVVGGIYLVFSNLDVLVEKGIETAGTNTIGSKVEVGSVDLDLLGGSASIYDFSIANPAGFSSGDMIRFSELSVSLNLIDTSGENLHITSVVARDPYVLYETREGTSNLDTVRARFENGETREDTSDEPSTQVVVTIDSILIENIQGTLQSDRLPGPVNVNLGDIRLNDLSGYPEDLAEQIVDPVISQLAATAARALVEATKELLSDTAGQVGERLEQSREQIQESLDAVSDQAEEALNKVGNLFKKDE